MGLEPISREATDFKSVVYANSTTGLLIEPISNDICSHIQTANNFFISLISASIAIKTLYP